jgi:hypothetical protein
MDLTESRDAHELLRERHRSGSMIITFKRGPDEWLAMFADPVRAQSAIDRFTSKSDDLVIDRESDRKRKTPKLDGPQARKGDDELKGACARFGGHGTRPSDWREPRSIRHEGTRNRHAA